MQEAFKKAVEREIEQAKTAEDITPGMELATEVVVSMSRLARAELDRAKRAQTERALSGLYRGYRDLGRSWQTLRLLEPANMHWGRFVATEEGVRNSWTNLQRIGRDMSLTIVEEVSALDNLRVGMDLNEELKYPHSHPLYTLFYVQITTGEFMHSQFIALIDEGPRYSPASHILMHAVADLSNMDTNQLNHFYEYMYDQQRGGQIVDLLETQRILSKYVPT